MEITVPSPHKLPADTGLAATVASIRSRLDVLATAPLDEDDVRALAVVDEWLADIAWAHEEAARGV